MQARSCNHSYRAKAISITHSECVFVAFGIKSAKRMRHIILPSVAFPALPNLSTLSRHNFFFGGGSMCFYFLSNFCLFLRNIWRHTTMVGTLIVATIYLQLIQNRYEGWNFNSGNYEYLFTTDTK